MEREGEHTVIQPSGGEGYLNKKYCVLLRHDSYTVQFIYLKFTIQWCSVHQTV